MKEDVAPGESRVFVVKGCEVAVFNIDGEYFAIDNLCPHQGGGPLVAGTLHGNTVTCPWHNWQFHLETGRSPVNPSISTPTYPVEVMEGQIRIEWKNRFPGEGL